MQLELVGLILAGYLAGSIPTAYLVGRWLQGIDLRRYGSGTVSGSMVKSSPARAVEGWRGHDGGKTAMVSPHATGLGNCQGRSAH